MDNIIVEVNYLEKGTTTFTFSLESFETEEVKSEAVITMEELRKFFIKFGVQYDDHKDVMENLKKLKENEAIKSILIRNYCEGLGNILCYLPKGCDIFVDTNKIGIDLLNNKFFYAKILI